jgi:acyl carrier protein
MNRNECLALMCDIYRNFLHETSASLEVSEETRLFGGNSLLDSTALVSFLIEVEQQINDNAGTNIVIADERAMSQKRSPFRSIGSLADYVQTLLAEVPST